MRQPCWATKFWDIVTHRTFKEMLRYSVSGAGSSVVHFLVVIFFVEYHFFTPLDANVLGCFIGATASYFGHRYWTFPGPQRHIHISLPMFLALAGLNFVLNQSLFFLLLHFTNIAYPIALALVMLVLGLLSFTLSKIWIFNH